MVPRPRRAVGGRRRAPPARGPRSTGAPRRRPPRRPRRNARRQAAPTAREPLETGRRRLRGRRKPAEEKSKGGLTLRPFDRILTFVRDMTTRNHQQSVMPSFVSLFISSRQSDSAGRSSSRRGPPTKFKARFRTAWKRAYGSTLPLSGLRRSRRGRPLTFGHTVRTPISHGRGHRTGPQLANELRLTRRSQITPSRPPPGGWIGRSGVDDRAFGSGHVRG